MKNDLKKNWQQALFLCFMLFAVAPIGGHASPTPAQWVKLNEEAFSVWKTGQGAGYVSFAWNPVNGATGYQVWYVNKTTNNSSWVHSTSNTDIQFPDLPAGLYAFHFKAIHEDGSFEYVVLDDLIIM